MLGYDGTCKHLHGHSYKLEVSLLGKVLKDGNHSKNEMVMDFGDLKNLVQRIIIEPWDHALLLHENSKPELIWQLQQNEEKLVLLPYQPSCENMLLDIKDRLLAKVPPGINLYRLWLSETENSYAEWYASDHKRSAAIS